jgi:hypothetical protein
MIICINQVIIFQINALTTVYVAYVSSSGDVHHTSTQRQLWATSDAQCFNYIGHIHCVCLKKSAVFDGGKRGTVIVGEDVRDVYSGD